MGWTQRFRSRLAARKASCRPALVRALLRRSPRLPPQAGAASPRWSEKPASREWIQACPACRRCDRVPDQTVAAPRPRRKQRVEPTAA